MEPRWYSRLVSHCHVLLSFTGPKMSKGNLSKPNRMHDLLPIELWSRIVEVYIINRGSYSVGDTIDGGDVYKEMIY